MVGTCGQEKIWLIVPAYRIDVRYISDALQKQEQKDAQHSTGGWQPTGELISPWEGLAYWPRFSPVFISLLHVATYEDVPVWVLVGKWKPEVREQIAAKFDLPKNFQLTCLMPSDRPDATLNSNSFHERFNI